MDRRVKDEEGNGIVYWSKLMVSRSMSRCEPVHLIHCDIEGFKRPEETVFLS